MASARSAFPVDPTKSPYYSLALVRRIIIPLFVFVHNYCCFMFISSRRVPTVQAQSKPRDIEERQAFPARSLTSGSYV